MKKSIECIYIILTIVACVTCKEIYKNNSNKLTDIIGGGGGSVYPNQFCAHYSFDCSQYNTVWTICSDKDGEMQCEGPMPVGYNCFYTPSQYIKCECATMGQYHEVPGGNWCDTDEP